MLVLNQNFTMIYRMHLLSWKGTQGRRLLIQTELGRLDKCIEKYTPLFLITFCLFTSCVLVLAGGYFTILGGVIGLMLMFVVLTYIGRVGNAIYIYSRKNFFFTLGFAFLYFYLVFRNYTLVIYGGQDPGYYQIYADVLSRGFGARFDSSAFEHFNNSGSYNLWSTNNTPSSSEIQFYPLLPTTLSLLIPIIGSNAYPVLAILCNLFVVCVVFDFLLSQKKLDNFFLPLVWLFIPATVWFSRIPASEILSTPLVLIALLLPFIISPKTKLIFWIYFFMSACLLLCRANPLLPTFLILGILWDFVLAKPSSLITFNFIKKFLAILIGSITAICFYVIFQPSFWTTYLIVELRKPTLFIISFLILFAILAVMLKTITSPILTFGVKSTYLINNVVRFIPLPIFLIINIYVLFSESWGVYLPENFGIGSSLYQRFGHTPFAFLLISLGFTLFLFKFKNTYIQMYFFALLTLCLLAVALRSPGIPYSYYFQRYWWSEVCLIVFLILVTSSYQNNVTQKNLTRNSLLRNSLVFLTILCQGIAFNLNSTKFTETGSSTTIALGQLSRYLTFQTTDLAFTSNVSPEFTSGVIIPLRYHFQNKISRIDTAGLNNSTFNKTQLISDTPCAGDTQLYFQNIPIQRLRGIGDFSLGSWILEERLVYVCKAAGNINR